MAHRYPFLKQLYFYVLLAIIAGLALGMYMPDLAIKMKVLGDGFLKLVKMVIAPVIFCTVVLGIAGMGSLKKIGRVGAKAIVYFEVVTTLALLIGLVIVNALQPGKGLNVSAASLDAKCTEMYVNGLQKSGTQDFILNIIPSGFFAAFVQGEILQVLFVSVLFGLALAFLQEKGKPVIKGIEALSGVFFGMVGIIMKVAPIGAFGAMAFTVGKYGFAAIHSLVQLMASVYLACLFFVFAVLGIILKSLGYNIFKFLRYIREEIVLVLATSSSEAALPGMMRKMEALGCEKSVVGLVIPTGYSFNLDGTSIYLTMAAVFIAQATNTPLDLGQQLVMLGVLMLTSKGAAAVTGGGFITLAATLSSLDVVPVAGISLLLGVDRLMSEARAITNLIGNGVATVVVAKWEKSVDEKIMKKYI